VNEYDLQKVSNLRVTASWSRPEWSPMQPRGNVAGPIAFDYGSKTVRFAASVDEAEAREIVGELKSQHTFPEVAA
jgi:hypothetical protein